MSKRIGILGGGQLAMMMTEAAHRLGHHISVLDPGENCPASIVGAGQVCKSFKNRTDIYNFINEVDIDVLTWDIESVDADTLIEIKNDSALSIDVHPNPHILKMIQNKWDQKYFLIQIDPNITNNYCHIDDRDILKKEPFILKTKYGGYDGKGVWYVDTVEDMNNIIDASGLPREQFYCEQYIKHNGEFASQVCIHNNEIIDMYNLVQTIQDPTYGICTKTTTHPTHIDSVTMNNLADKAYNIMDKICEKFTSLGHSYTGVLSIELFLTDKGDLIINELSPRVHNSGHYTIEGCHTSQFESHIRLITNNNIDSINTALVDRTMEYVMVNILATCDNTKDTCSAYDTSPSYCHHWYNKHKRAHELTYTLNRKLGHYTYQHKQQHLLTLPQIVLSKSATDAKLEIKPEVYIVMGSSNDLDQMQACIDLVKEYGISYKVDIVSAHRSPEWMFEFGRNVQSWGGKIVIAAAGGAAHLPGMLASLTNLPVIGVPIETRALGGQDSLYSIVQMPDGVPVATVGIGKSINAAILAFKILERFDIVEQIKKANVEKVETQRANYMRQTKNCKKTAKKLQKNN